MDTPNQKHEAKQLSKQWVWLIEQIQAENMVFGEVKIILHNGEPVEIVEMLRRKRYN